MRALRTYHPAVTFGYFALMIVLSFMTTQPVFRVAGLLAAVALGIAVSGCRAFVRASWWYLVLIIVIAVANMLFNSQGLTVLFEFFGSACTLEALCYGLATGAMLACAMLWFASYNKLMSQAGFLALFARFAPTITLMIARITYFVPALIEHGRRINQAQSALFGSAQPKNKRLVYATALTSQLMEWGMESSLTTADSMRARGYGSTQRSHYRTMRLALRDIVVLAALAVLGGLSLFLTLVANGQYSFYPYMSQLKIWWGYLPYILLCLVPFFVEGGERLLWTLSRSKM